MFIIDFICHIACPDFLSGELAIIIIPLCERKLSWLVSSFLILSGLKYHHYFNKNKKKFYFLWEFNSSQNIIFVANSF
ncbi:hypothetical protein SAMN06265379_10287 [Saccharicrinis carchari]|uniref:Uncharacterized protein n=1 Tax=Saccharicrinis carchari TaxID=1168039 RepID=A0A521BUL8_SACCC|nr:hypothetical protein SAMN06265379_10287 [Saccharicrinis carchari]